MHDFKICFHQYNKPRGIIMNELIRYVLIESARVMTISSEEKVNMLIAILTDYLRPKMK